jgi:uncharacterized protein YyaL (SSP411 family)
MDETTYSHAGVIELINNEYVPIRVDNDVRPDINQRYNMGGWPSTAFLTASGDILTGATYLPPDQMADALTRVAGYYRTNQPEIASRVLEARKRAASTVAHSAGSLDEGIVDSILEAVTNATIPSTAASATHPSFRKPTQSSFCSNSRTCAPTLRCVRWRSTRSGVWRAAAPTTMSKAASSATRPHRIGASRTSRRCWRITQAS